MSTDSNPVGTPSRRYRGLVVGFVLGVVISAIVMGFLWSSDSARQKGAIDELSSEISEKDATINTLSSQLAERDKGGETSNSESGGSVQNR